MRNQDLGTSYVISGTQSSYEEAARQLERAYGNPFSSHQRVDLSDAELDGMRSVGRLSEDVYRYYMEHRGY